MGAKISKATKCVRRQCEIDECPLVASDKPNAFAHLGFRVGYTIVSWFVLGINVSKTAFFVSLFLFVLPLMMDCLKFTPISMIRKRIRNIEVMVSALWVMFALLGLLGILVLENADGTVIIKTSSEFIGFTLAGIDVQGVWRALLTMVFLTIVDWLCMNV